MPTRFVGIIALGIFLFSGSTAYAAADPEASCKKAKAKAVGKKTLDLVKAFGKNFKKPTGAKLD